MNRTFFRTLVDILDDYYVFPQIHLGSITTPKVRRSESHGWKFWRYARTSADRRSVDFVICNKLNLQQLFVIELDGVEHRKKDHIKRDQELNRILDESDIVLLRIENSEIDDIDSLKEKIHTVLSFLEK